MRSPILWLAITMVLLVLTAWYSPIEKSLGANVRIVYLHGAWVWTALIFIGASGLAGFTALVGKRSVLHCWSRVLGYTGLFFWITYLPLSLWAMQANWNGLFLAEPRWRIGFVFAIGGLILQIGLALVRRNSWTSVGNVFYVLTLLVTLPQARNVMHPPSPVFSSDSTRIQLYFLILLVFTLLLGVQITHWWLKREAC